MLRLWEAPDWLPTWVADSVARIACRIWGHQPAAECSIPEHDFCLWCQRSMPGQFVRSGQGGETAVTHG